MENYWNQFIAYFITRIPSLLSAVVIFILSLYLARLISNILKRVLGSRKAPEGVTHLLGQLTFWTIIIIGLITALERFFEVTAFLAGLGIVGFTVGFALQDIMKNFASGIILLLQQPFHIGESIELAGFEGTVLAIDLRTTEIRALDGRIVILPNASVLANPIVNYTRASQRRVELSLSLSHGTDPDAARQIILEAIEEVLGFVGKPAPVIVFDNLTSSALVLTVNFWIDVSKNNPAQAKDTVLLKVKSSFNQQGIEIPHPVQAVYSKSG
jgi:small conductance mechanosensitive channel